MHLDLGVEPATAAAEAVYGDYGAASLRAVVEDLIIRVISPGQGNVTVKINGKPATVDTSGLDAEETCAAIALTIFGSIISNGLPVMLKSESCAVAGGRRIVIGTQDEAVGFASAVEVAGGDWVVVEREEARDLRTHRFLPDVSSANRRGILRYGVLSALFGDGQAQDDAMISKISPWTFAHELGHTVGLNHWGHWQWGTEGLACIPQYASLMSYAGGAGFTTNETPWTLQPAATKEYETLGPTYDYQRFTPNPFNFTVAATSVDWNRDGNPEPTQTPYRSFALVANSKGCRSFVAGRSLLADVNDIPTGAPDLVRFGDRLYALWPSTSGTLRTRSAPLGAAGNKGCTGSANPLDATGQNPNPCLVFSPAVDLAALETPLGVSALVHNNQLLVASNLTQGEGLGFKVRRYTRDATSALTLVATDWTPLGACDS